MSRLALLFLFLALPACQGRPESAGEGGAWVGTISTEGDVTTVVNESGSVWGGTATLVEDLSIGVAQGDEPYMFGRVTSVWATTTEIYVVDSQSEAVRVFDAEGRYLRDIGRPGPGPGENQEPGAVAVFPDGRIAVRSSTPGQKTSVYAADGTYLETWRGEPSFGTSTPPVMSHDGEFFTQTYGSTDEERAERSMGMARPGRDGIEGPLHRFPSVDRPERPPGIQVGNANYGVPFSPGVRQGMLPSGAMVAGATTEYRLLVDRPSGERLVIERPMDALSISAEEREWQRRRTLASIRRRDPSFTWDGAEIPEHHPTFTTLLGDRNRRLWVVRPARVAAVPDCSEDPLETPPADLVACFTMEYIADVFDEETGKLLGEVEQPPGVSLSGAFIDDDRIYLPLEDAEGTIQVKRFRLVMPGAG